MQGGECTTHDADSYAYPRAALWELPEEVVFHIVSFVAASTRRASVICHSIGPLCKASYQRLLRDSHSSARLWDIVFQQDYCCPYQASEVSTRKRQIAFMERRECKRLCRRPVHKVRDAHRLIVDRTEICYYYLSELTNSRGLSRAKLVRLVNEYGPHLRINETVSSGGLFLVEVCRARNVKESTILNCVRELVEQQGAVVNTCTNEPPASLTALAVAAARGMPTAVKYLLQAGADPSLAASGRFRLHANPKKSVRCDVVPPVEFARCMMQAEEKEGAPERALRNLARCIKLLNAHQA